MNMFMNKFRFVRLCSARRGLSGSVGAFFATCESKAACTFSLKLTFLLHFRPWDLSRKMRREILIEKEVLNVLRDALGVELWTFYCKPKNFGPNVIYYVL